MSFCNFGNFNQMIASGATMSADFTVCIMCAVLELC